MGEQMCYQYRQTLEEEKLKAVFTEEEKASVNKATDEALKWINDHPQAAKEEYDAKVKELEATFNPIMMRVYQQTGGQPGAGGMPGGMPGGFPGGMPNMNFPGGAPGADPSAG